MTAPTLERMLAEQAVKDRLVAYWRDVDRHLAAGALDYYTEDCVYDMLDHRMRGRAAVQAYYAERNARGPRLVRHVVTNLLAERVDDAQFRLEGTLIVHAADGVPVLPSAPPILVADWASEWLRCADGAWRMRTHRLVALFSGGVPVFVPGQG